MSTVVDDALVREPRLRLRRGRAASPSLRIGVASLATLLGGALTARLVLGSPNDKDLAHAFSSPGQNGFLLGSDPLGRDLLAWCAAGVFTAVVVAIAVVVLSATLGVVVGLLAGYVGGAVDAVLMRLVDLQLAIPPILMFLAASAVLDPSVINLIVLLSIAGWVPYARVVRARTLSERERPYVAAARLAGSGPMKIVARHLLPAMTTQVLVIASLQAGYVMLWESGLSFLGLGVQPPRASLGYMIAQGKEFLTVAWWVVTVPGIVVVALVLAFNLIGDGLRDRYAVDKTTLW